MGHQTGFGFEAAEVNPGHVTLPAAPRRKPEAFEEWPEGKPLTGGEQVTLIHRTGRVKLVRFDGVPSNRIHLTWPIANDTVEVSLRTGAVVFPKALREWYLEPNAFNVIKESQRRGDR